MNATLKEIVEAGRDVLRITFIAPVRQGSPRPNAWPIGLGPVGWIAAATFALLVAATFASNWLRQHDVLVASGATTQALPALSIPLLMTAVLLAFSMVLTAALHAPWWLRIGLVVIGSIASLVFSLGAGSDPAQQVVALSSLFALLGFIIIRSFRSYAWWEFPTVLVLLTASLLLPWALPTYNTFGMDLRPSAIEGGFVMLSILMLPAVMVAGFAPAQIVVTGAQAIADRPVSRGLFWTVFAVALAGLAISAALFFVTGDPPTVAGMLASLGRLVLTGGLVMALLKRANTSHPPPPAAFPEAWSGWVYPIAAALAGSVLLNDLVAFFASGAALYSPGEVTNAFAWLFNLIYENDSTSAWRGVVSIIVLIAAWRFAARGRLTEAIMLGTYSAMTISYLAGAVPSLDFALVGTAQEIGLIVAAIALAAAAVQLVRRRFDRGSATGVLTVLLLNLLYPYRDFLSDPITTSLAVAPAAMLVFGLAWRVMTEAEVTYHSSKRYPQSTRVLLFMANSLLATTGIAFVALSRATGTLADTSGWAGVGDALLGQPLYVAGLVTGLWLILRPHPRGEVIEELTDEHYDAAEAALADDAVGADDAIHGWPTNTDAPHYPQQ